MLVRFFNALDIRAEIGEIPNGMRHTRVCNNSCVPFCTREEGRRDACRSARGGAVAPALPVKARSRLDAVLAAGMARMSSQKAAVPTDAPKREREYEGADDLDVL